MTVGSTLLLVDDEPDIVEALRDFLTFHLPESRILTARHGEEALKLLGKEDVTLMVTDYKMPGMNGVELTKEAHKIKPGLPCLLISAYDLEHALTTMALPPVTAFSAKPLDPMGVLKQVRTLIQPAT